MVSKAMFSDCFNFGSRRCSHMHLIPLITGSQRKWKSMGKKKTRDINNEQNNF